MNEYEVEKRVWLNRNWDLVLKGKIQENGRVSVTIDLFSKPYKTVVKKKSLFLTYIEAEKFCSELRKLLLHLQTKKEHLEGESSED